MKEPLSNEKRVRKLTLSVHYCETRTSWNNSALVFIDSSGDQASRKVVLNIERPSDISYIRERLQNIEDAWARELATAKYP